MYRFRALTSHTLLVMAQTSLVALLVVGLVAGTAFAGKGGNGNGGGGNGGGGSTSGGGTLALVLAQDTDGDAAVSWGDKVTFTVSTTATDKPFVSVNCNQNGVWVYTASVGFFPSYPWSQNFTLSSTMWAGGSASCNATLYSVDSRGRQQTLATLAFPVAE